MVDPVSLRVLLAVHDTGSVTRAARLLDYTAPNLTQHLRKLERALHAPMVARAGRGIVLTPQALAILDTAREIVDNLDSLPDRARLDTEPSGRLRIAAFPTALRGLVIPAMAAVRARYPRLDLVPTELEPEPALELLRNGRLDAVVDKSFGTPPAGPDPEGLRSLPLGRDPLDVVLPLDHPLAARSWIALAELARDRLAITSNEDPYASWIAMHSPDLLTTVHTAYQAVEVASLVSYVEQGLAVTILPRMGRPGLPDQVRAVPLADADAFRSIALVVRSISANSSPITALGELFSAGLTLPPPLR